ncbi:hypothetical protein GCM10010278_61390 [Streptomyces melanogenes]|nr:hypothetical protein GCM10010278_61390 [Streptomyces melanogenes]
MDNSPVVNIPFTYTGDFQSAPEPLRSVTSLDGQREEPTRPEGGVEDRVRGPKMHPDMRRPPPGGRAGVVSPADSGGEEPDRVSTVANDP